MKLSWFVLHTLEIYLLPLPMLNSETRWNYTQWISLSLLSKPFTLLMVLVLLWRDNAVNGFLFTLHHQVTLSTRLVNSLEKTSVYDKMCEQM